MEAVQKEIQEMHQYPQVQPVSGATTIAGQEQEQLRNPWSDIGVTRVHLWYATGKIYSRQRDTKISMRS